MDHMFRGLLVCVATLESFAHGANDTANSTGPMSAMIEAHTAGLYGGGRGCGGTAGDGGGGRSTGAQPSWVMAVAGACVSAGVVVAGGRVIQTVGKDISRSVDFHKGCSPSNGCQISRASHPLQ